MAEGTYNFDDGPDDQYMADVQSYLSKVRAGRQVTRPPKTDPKFSETAEMLRQARTFTDEVNAQQDQAVNAQVGSESYDFGDTKAIDQGGTFDFSDGQPEASTGTPSQPVEKPTPGKKPFHPGQILDTFMGSIDPELPEILFGPRAKAGVEWNTPTTIFEGLAKDLHDLPHTLTDIALTPATWLTSPAVGRGVAIAPGVKPVMPPGPPTPIAPGELADQVASRALTKSAIETGAFPDPEAMPQLRKPTGRTLVVPDFDPGVKSDAIQSDMFVPMAPKPYLIPKGGKPGLPNSNTIEMGRPIDPTMTSGEYGTGDQTSLLGGYNVRGNESYLTGKYPLGADEQMATGMMPLRPQVQTRAGSTAAEQKRLQDWALGPQTGKGGVVQPGLRDRVLTPKMERDLATPEQRVGTQPVTVTKSKSGMSASVVPGDYLTTAAEIDIPTMSKDVTLPSTTARATKSALDAVRTMGTLPEAAANIIETNYANRAILFSQDFLNAEREIMKVAPPTNLLQRAKLAAEKIGAGENAFLNGLRRSYGGITAEEEKSIFDYMYSQGRIQPLNEKVRTIGDAIYNNVLYPASSDPGVRTLSITNPFTGKEIPLGQPTMFMPQQPIKEITTKAINDTQWNILYERMGGSKTGVSLQDFKNTVVKFSKHDHEIEAARAKGLENMRLLDLESLGGSPYDWAKKLGYETDPLRAALKYNSVARLRGQFAQSEPTINAIKQAMPQNTPATEWFTRVMDRAMLNPSKHDTWELTRRGLAGISHALDVTMLQKGGLANMAQASYVTARGGIRNTYKGMLDMLTGKDREMVFTSGAMHPSVMNELINPSGPLASFSSGAFRLYGLSMVDRFTRAFAGHVGNRYVDATVDSFLRNPGNTKLSGLIKELGGDPQAILQEQAIPDDMKRQMIQRFANMTSGITDVRGIPEWATTSNPWARLVNKYRTFTLANSAEIRRLVNGAPDKATAAARINRLILGSGLIGGSIYNVEEQLRQALSGAPAKDKEGWIDVIAPWVYGLGTFEGSMIMNALSRDATSAVVSAVGGPPAGVAASLLDDLKQTAEKGVGWRTVDTVSKRLPIVGPVTGPLVSGEIKAENKQEQLKRQYLGK